MRAARVVAPTTLPEAVELLAGPGTAPLGGGVALMLQQARGGELPATLVSLRGIPGLAEVELTDGTVEIGALASLSSIARTLRVVDVLPALQHALAQVGSPRIRNQATIGGNIAARVARHDPPVVLIALDARVRLAGPRGGREVPLESWTLDQHALRAGEVITAVAVPLGRGRDVARYLAIRTTGGGHAAASTRLVIGPDGAVADARLVVADPELPPRRVPLAEASMRGRRPDQGVVGDAAALVTLDALGHARSGTTDHDRERLLQTAARRVLAAAAAEAMAPDASDRVPNR